MTTFCDRARLRAAATCGGGFALMELMIAIGILAILATLALPSYEGAATRDQIVSAVPLADIVKARMAQSWAATQSFPADNAAAGLPPAEKIVNNYISAIDISGGAIQITFGNSANKRINGKTLTLRPAVVEDAPIVPVTWICGFGAVPDKMAVRGENRTTIPQGYLPVICRGQG
jgi:type IV pilus assembly protein PilA